MRGGHEREHGGREARGSYCKGIFDSFFQTNMSTSFYYSSGQQQLRLFISFHDFYAKIVIDLWEINNQNQKLTADAVLVLSVFQLIFMLLAKYAQQKSAIISSDFLNS